MLSVLNGLIAVLCLLLLLYAGVVMLYVAKHDGPPPPFPRRLRKFDPTGESELMEDLRPDRDDP